MGWTPEVSWHTPIDEISRAYHRKIRWHNALNGVTEKDTPSKNKFGKPEPMTAEKRQDVASKLRGFLGARKTG